MLMRPGVGPPRAPPPRCRGLPLTLLVLFLPLVPFTFGTVSYVQQLGVLWFFICRPPVCPPSPRPRWLCNSAKNASPASRSYLRRQFGITALDRSRCCPMELPERENEGRKKKSGTRLRVFAISPFNVGALSPPSFLSCRSRGGGPNCGFAIGPVPSKRSRGVLKTAAVAAPHPLMAYGDI